jgi:hypothetical protein
MITPLDIAIPLQRITWRDGQALLSRDLRDQQQAADRLRHLHIRYLHRTWGIVEGLNVEAAANGTLLVAAGYALDIEGNELLRPLSARVTPPPEIVTATTMYLVLSRAVPVTDCAAPLALAALCPGAADPIPLEQGVLTFKRVAEVRPGTDVLLARILVTGGALASAVDTSVQRRATSTNVPHFWSDQTSTGQTGWSDVSGAAVPQITATVDMSDAGFIATPATFAQLAGAALPAPAFIASVGPTSFSFDVLLNDAATRRSVANAAQAEAAGWTVTWFAIEPRSQGSTP